MFALLALLSLFYCFYPDAVNAHPLVWGLLLLAAVNLRTVTGLRQRLAVIDLLPLVAVLMCWTAPALQYWLESNHPFTAFPMQTPAERYFQVAIPGVLAVCGAFYLPLPWLQRDERERQALKACLAALQGRIYVVPLLMALSLAAVFVAHRAPAALQFPLYLLQLLLSVAALIPVLQTDWPYRWWWIGAAFALAAAEALYSSMFGGLLSLGLLVILYASFWRRWSVWRLLLGQLVLFLGLFWLIAFKYEYRAVHPWNLGWSERVSQFVRLGLRQLAHPVTNESVDEVTARLNQGANISLMLNYVPVKQGFVQGETVVSAVKSALAPRLLWPDKPRAGGVENVRRFMGIENLGYSINLGLIGEAYVNFGVGWRFVLYLVLYVLFFRLAYGLVTRYCLEWPGLILLLPLIFFPVITVEKDLLTVLNHVVKAGFLVLGCCFLARHLALRKI